MLSTKLSAAPVRAGQRPFAPARKSVVIQAKFNHAPIVQELEKEMMKKTPPQVKIGDTVKMGIAVSEGNGKTRTQTLEGTIIAQHGSGVNKTVTFRRIFQGVGIELIVPLHSPVVQFIQPVKSGKVRRAKLYFLRERLGKSAKLKEVVGSRKAAAAAAAAAAKAK